MSDATEGRLIEIAARWEAICDLLDGKEASDFMLAYPEVRQVADLVGAFPLKNYSVDGLCHCKPGPHIASKDFCTVCGKDIR